LDTPGNAGAKDVLLALQWIHKYIRHFNGDSRNITLLGQGEGAGMAHLLSCSPKAKGLFHKIILQSGSMLSQLCNLPRSDLPYLLALKNGYTGPNNERHILAFLRLLPKEAVARWDILTPNEHMLLMLSPFAPTIEPYETSHTLIIRPFLEMISRAWGNKLPMIIGGTSFEGAALLFRDDILNTLIADRTTFIDNCILPLDLDVVGERKLDLKKQLVKVYEFYSLESKAETVMKFLKVNHIP